MEIDPNAPATKHDISLVKQDIEILRSEVAHGYHDLKEAMRDVQTELLKAFYNYAQTTT